MIVASLLHAIHARRRERALRAGWLVGAFVPRCFCCFCCCCCCGGGCLLLRVCPAFHPRVRMTKLRAYPPIPLFRARLAKQQHHHHHHQQQQQQQQIVKIGDRGDALRFEKGQATSPAGATRGSPHSSTLGRSGSGGGGGGSGASSSSPLSKLAGEDRLCDIHRGRTADGA